MKTRARSKGRKAVAERYKRAGEPAPRAPGKGENRESGAKVAAGPAAQAGLLRHLGGRDLETSGQPSHTSGGHILTSATVNLRQLFYPLPGPKQRFESPLPLISCYIPRSAFSEGCMDYVRSP